MKYFYSILLISLFSIEGLIAQELKIIENVFATGIIAPTVQSTRLPVQAGDIPQSVSIIGQTLIREQSATDLVTITRNMTGINFTGNYSGAGSYQFFNARGFDLNDRQNYRLNGLMIWNLGNNYSDNIEQIEFLKGPASIIFGDVAPGGVLNFITKKALPEFYASLDFKTGSYNLLRPSIDITGPLTKDRKLKFRLNASLENAGSFRDFVKKSSSFIAPALTWDFTPRLSVSVETVFKRSASTDDAGLISPDGTIAGLKRLKPSLFLGEPSHKYLYSDQNFSATLKYRIVNSWDIKTVFFYGNTNNRPYGIWFGNPDSAGNFIRRQYGYHQNSKTVTATMQLTGSFYTAKIKHTVLAGIDYQLSSARYTNEGSLYVLDSSNIYNPSYRTDVNVPANGPFLPSISLIRQISFFAQDQISFFSGSLKILAGIRAGNNWQGIHYFQTPATGGNANQNARDIIVLKHSLIPRLGIVFHVFDWSVYASYSKGYEINSPDLFAHNYSLYQSPPATLSRQLEFGLKSGLLNNHIGLTLCAFQLDKFNPYGYVYLDRLHPDYDAYDVYYQGHHRSRGIEFEMSGQLIKGLTITGGCSLLNTAIIDDPGYRAGNSLANSPKYTLNTWLNYRLPGKFNGISLGSGYFYKAAFFSSLANDPKLKIPKGYTLDLSAAYTYKQASVQVNLSNFTNQTSYSNPWQFNMFEIKPLRQIVIALSYTLSGTKTSGIQGT